MQGIKELFTTLSDQPRNAMSNELYDRFTGVAHVRGMLEESQTIDCDTKMALVNKGKNCWAVEKVLQEMGVQIVDNQCDADLLLIGTLSPGPMLDAWQSYANSKKRVELPWHPTNLDLKASSGSNVPANIA